VEVLEVLTTRLVGDSEQVTPAEGDTVDVRATVPVNP
jgi:hypothetical protein